MEILQSSRNFIRTRIKWLSENFWFYTFVYGNPQQEFRGETLTAVANLMGNNEDSWCSLGKVGQMLLQSRLEFLVYEVATNIRNEALELVKTCVTEDMNKELEREIANSTSTRITPPPTTWSPPTLNTIKVNCDASFDCNRKFAGIATVARNRYGIFIDGINAQVHVSRAFVVECLALRLGSYLIEQHGWQQVIVESDCKLAIQMINRLTSDSWEAKAILSDIRNLTESRLNVIFSCISRLSNHVADWVAKATCKGKCPSNWMRHIPDDLFHML
ncbi:hypothetical protein V6N12_066360 [Hibiscus sabdariffa]|uniref:RNase H type-1 domain-containing protein n=1 Tax=Hibiscus sabdariffa TaxID=183260 RepID=A0ABR2CPW0_9ROSI